MCGISGIISFKKKKYNKEIVKINELLSHRGPDMTGYYIDESKGVYLGHKRLSILDLSNSGKQPMVDKLNRYVISFNGEIYNYNYLKQKYLKNISLKSSTDTEVLLEGFSKYGVEFFNFCDGMFALAIHDKLLEKTYLFRDRAGEKPLYYNIDNNRLAFSSELNSLISLNDINKNFNKTALIQFLVLKYTFPENSIIKNIKKIKPGTFLIINNKGQITINRYYCYNLKQNIHYSQNDFEIKKKELQNLLYASVDNRVKADVEVGCFLSGGVDSSLITTIASQISKKKINTFSFGIKNVYEEDNMIASDISKEIGTRHHQILVTEKKVLEYADDIDSIIDEPNGDGSLLPYYILSNFASKYNKVILTGDGADELFAGYRRYPLLNDEYNDRFVLKNFDFKKRISYYLLNRLKNFDIQDNKTLENIFFNSLDNFNILFNKIDHPSMVFKEFDFHSYLHGSVLSKIDIASMKNSLELRSPYLDKEILDLSMSIPVEYCLNNKLRKIILLDILRKNISIQKLLIGNKKTGFGVKGFFLSLKVKNFLVHFINNNLKYLPIENYLHNFIKNNYSQNVNALWSTYVLIKWTKKYF